MNADGETVVLSVLNRSCLTSTVLYADWSVIVSQAAGASYALRPVSN